MNSSFPNMLMNGSTHHHIWNIIMTWVLAHGQCKFMWWCDTTAWILYFLKLPWRLYCDIKHGRFSSALLSMHVDTDNVQWWGYLCTYCNFSTCNFIQYTGRSSTIITHNALNKKDWLHVHFTWLRLLKWTQSIDAIECTASKNDAWSIWPANF